MAETDVNGVAMACRTLCHHARRTIGSGYLTAEILGKQELRVDANRAGEDVLTCQMNGYRIAHVVHILVHRCDIVPIEIGARGQLQQFAEKAVLGDYFDT